MAITNEDRIRAEEKASEIQLRLYSAPESGEMLWKIATKFNLTERRQYRVYAGLVGDVVLGFYKPSDIPALLRYTIPSLTEELLSMLIEELNVFLLPLNSVSVESLVADISATEHDIAALQNVRTMAHDMQVAQGVSGSAMVETTYQSSQADILRPTVVAPAPPETPRWETE